MHEGNDMSIMITLKKPTPERGGGLRDAQIMDTAVLCQEGWPLRQQDWPFGLPEPQGGQRQVCREEETAWDDRSI